MAVMKNEVIVEKIRNGISVTDNMQTLYENNLPLIKKIAKPFIVYDCEADLLQEAYFGLLEAVKHYETSENVLFMTYAGYWIKQAVQRYLEKCGSTVRIPSHIRQKIARYKKAVQEMEQELGRTPTDNEIACKMRMPVGLLPELKMQMQDIASLDTPLSGKYDITLADTVQADYSLENDVIDKIYAEHSENELWGISLDRIRQIKESGIRKLRRGKARRELLRKFDIAEKSLYRGGSKNYKEHDFTSVVEYIAIRKLEAEKRYKKHMEEIENRRTTHQKPQIGAETC